MSKPCNREACALRLERLAASAKILAEQLRGHVWYEEALKQAAQIHDDAQIVHEQICGDKAWEAGDR
jgi:hypothetical protein